MSNLEIDETLKTPVTALDPAHNVTKATMYCIVLYCSIIIFVCTEKCGEDMDGN